VTTRFVSIRSRRPTTRRRTSGPRSWSTTTPAPATRRRDPPVDSESIPRLLRRFVSICLPTSFSRRSPDGETATTGALPRPATTRSRPDRGISLRPLRRRRAGAAAHEARRRSETVRAVAHLEGDHREPALTGEATGPEVAGEPPVTWCAALRSLENRSFSRGVRNSKELASHVDW